MRFIKKWWEKNKKILKFVLALFLIWQLGVGVIIALGQQFFPTTHAYVYTETIEGGGIIHPKWLWSRANFDGMHYLGIAKSGYGLYQQAFFPFYPSLIKWLTPLFQGRDVLVGWLISAISFFLGLFFLYQLVRLDYPEKIARRTLIYLLIFPTAFFFSMVYTESLFLFLVSASFYFARTKRWWLAGIFGGFASATRVVGIFLLPAFVVEFYQQMKKENHKNVLRVTCYVLPLCLIPLGLLYYMRFLQINYRDPLMFLHVQPYFGAGRAAGRLILLYQVFWRYLKMLLTVEKFTPTYFVVILEVLSGLLFLGLTIFTYLRRWFPYLVFMALAYITPTLTGTFSSLPRYALVLFPGFILLSLWAEKYQWARKIYPIVCGFLFVISLLFFSRGYWVA